MSKKKKLFRITKLRDELPNPPEDPMPYADAIRWRESQFQENQSLYAIGVHGARVQASLLPEMNETYRTSKHAEQEMMVGKAGEIHRTNPIELKQSKSIFR